MASRLRGVGPSVWTAGGLVGGPVLEEAADNVQSTSRIPKTSSFDIGAILQDRGRGLQPVAYYSRFFWAFQLDYSVQDKELLVMYQACMRWFHNGCLSPSWPVIKLSLTCSRHIATALDATPGDTRMSLSSCPLYHLLQGGRDKRCR